MSDLLPDSRAKETRGRISVGGVIYVPIFCANCGCNGGGVPEEHMTFSFYLCNPCAEKWGPIAGTMTIPDEVFFEKIKNTQLEEYGRILTSDEMKKELDNVESPMSKLARDEYKGK